MDLWVAVVAVLRALTFGLLWLLAVCWWIVLPLTHEVRYAGLAVIGVAIWLQHRPRGEK
jgi:hypothetical protein